MPYSASMATMMRTWLSESHPGTLSAVVVPVNLKVIEIQFAQNDRFEPW